MTKGLMSKQCISCGSENLTRGDLRSAFISFGQFFLTYKEGTDSPGNSIQKENKVISYACEDCGVIFNILQRKDQE